MPLGRPATQSELRTEAGLCKAPDHSVDVRRHAILLDTIAAAVIGGVSLFGGRGHIRAAVLGSLVIAMIANGTDLVGYSASTQYIITGAILLAAVTLDTLSRRRMTASGR